MEEKEGKFMNKIRRRFGQTPTEETILERDDIKN